MNDSTRTTINTEHIVALLSMINKSPFFLLLSMVVREIGLGHALLEVEVTRKHHNPFGGIHGGVYASIIDTAAYWAAYCSLDDQSGLTTLDLQVNNLAPLREGKLIVTGRLIKAGRTICLAEASVTNEAEKLLALGYSKMLVTPGIQTIDQAVASSGSRPLPPKFLLE